MTTTPTPPEAGPVKWEQTGQGRTHGGTNIRGKERQKEEEIEPAKEKQHEGEQVTTTTTPKPPKASLVKRG